SNVLLTFDTIGRLRSHGGLLHCPDCRLPGRPCERRSSRGIAGMHRTAATAALILLGIVASQQSGAAHMSDHASVSSEPFGKTAAGVPVRIYTLRNSKGMEARILDYGGTIVSLTAPDRSGQ